MVAEASLGALGLGVGEKDSVQHRSSTSHGAIRQEYNLRSPGAIHWGDGFEGRTER